MKNIENAIASIAPQDTTAPLDVEKIIGTHALGASSAVAASCILPGAGEAIAPVVALTFTSTMYYRLAKRMGLNMPRNALKAIASVVIAETSVTVAAALGLAAVFSFLPGIGTGGAIMIASIAAYMMVDAAGKMFLLILSRLFRAKTLADIEKMSEDELRNFAKGCATKKVVKELVKESKKNYQRVKNDMGMKQQADSIQIDVDVTAEPGV